MIIYLDTERSPQAGLVESADDDTAKQLSPFFWNDKFTLELFIVGNQPSWIGDSLSVVKLRLGTLPNKFYTSPIVGTWSGDHYEFELDLTTSLFDDQIITNLTKSGFVEIQVESGTFSQTLLQQKATFNNTFLASSEVTLTEPLEPSFIETEYLTAPIAPSEFLAISSPLKPSNLALGFAPLPPRFIKSGNLSILPILPSRVETQIIRLRPTLPTNISSSLGGFPVPTSVPFARLWGTIPGTPSDMGSRIVTIPIAPLVEVFEVVKHEFHSNHHKFLSLEIEGSLSERMTGSPIVDSSVPFTFAGIDSNGSPTYLRKSNVDLINPITGRTQSYEHIKLVARQVSYFSQDPLVLNNLDDALLYGQSILEANVNNADVFIPENQPLNIGDLDAKLYDVQVLIGYNYDTDDSFMERPNTLFFSKVVNAVYPVETQLGKLGINDLGGNRVSYLEGKVDEVINATDGGRAEYAGEHNFAIKPTFNPQVAPPPIVVSTPTAIQLFEPSVPTNPDALILDFVLDRYNPVIWLDASQEHPEHDFESLTNFASTYYEVKRKPDDYVLPTYFSNRTQNNLPLFDFSSTENSYIIPSNIFGRHFSNKGGEVEIFLAYKPLDFDPIATLTFEEQVKYANLGITPTYRPHLFTRLGAETERFTAHAPFYNGRFYLDAGEQGVARVSSSTTFNYGGFHILLLRASTERQVIQIWLDGVKLGETTHGENLIYSAFAFGGWGRRGYGQSMLLGEALFFKNKLEETQREEVEGYLSHKWGVTSQLPLSHPYRNTQPNNFGEYRPLDPFPRDPDFCFADSTPSNPSNPFAGIPTTAPSNPIAVAFPNAPSGLDSIFFPDIFFKSNDAPISNFQTNGTILDLPDILQEIRTAVNGLVAYNDQDQEQNVTWTIANQNNVSEFTIGFDASQSTTPPNFSLVQNTQIFVQEFVTRNLSFDVKIENANGDQNFFKIKFALLGIARSDESITIEDINAGGQIVNGKNEFFEIVDPATPLVLQGKDDGYCGTRKNFNTPCSKNWLIGHTQRDYEFKLRVFTPDVTGARLYIHARKSYYSGAPNIGSPYESQYAHDSVLRYGTWVSPYGTSEGDGYEHTRDEISEVTSGMIFRPTHSIYKALVVKEYFGYHRKTLVYHRRPDLVEDLGLAPYQVECTQINETIPGVEKVYHFKFSIFDDRSGLEDQTNALQKLFYEATRIYPDAVQKPDWYAPVPLLRSTFFSEEKKYHQGGMATPEQMGNDPTLGFNIKFKTHRGKVTLPIFPASYNCPPPTFVRATEPGVPIGLKNGGRPSNLEVKYKKANFPSELALQAKPYLFPLWSNNFNWCDPQGRFMDYDANDIPLDRFYVDGQTKGEGKLWTWGIDFGFPNEEFKCRHLYIHYTKLNNIKVENAPYPVYSDPYKYPFDWSLEYDYTNESDLKILEFDYYKLDSQTLYRLKNTSEKIITFPSGFKTTTQFGGYVQTSKQFSVEVYLAKSVNGNWQPEDSPIYTFNIEPNNMEGKKRLGGHHPQTLGSISPPTTYFYRRYAGDYRYKVLYNLPPIALPILMDKRDRYFDLDVPRAMLLHPDYQRMLGDTELAQVYGGNSVGLISASKVNSQAQIESASISKRIDDWNHFFDTDTQQIKEKLNHWQAGSYNWRWQQGGSAYHATIFETPDQQFYKTNGRIFTRLKVTAPDVADPSVHPQWGLSYEDWRFTFGDNSKATLSASSVRFEELPLAPSNAKIVLPDVPQNEGSEVYNYLERQFYLENRPKNPSEVNLSKKISYRDLVRSTETQLTWNNLVYDKYLPRNRLFWVVTERAYIPISSSQKGYVNRFDVYELKSLNNIHYEGATGTMVAFSAILSRQKLNSEETDSADEIRLSWNSNTYLPWLNDFRNLGAGYDPQIGDVPLILVKKNAKDYFRPDHPEYISFMVGKFAVMVTDEVWTPDYGTNVECTPWTTSTGCNSWNLPKTGDKVQILGIRRLSHPDKYVYDVLRPKQGSRKYFRGEITMPYFFTLNQAPVDLFTYDIYDLVAGYPSPPINPFGVGLTNLISYKPLDRLWNPTSSSIENINDLLERPQDLTLQGDLNKLFIQLSGSVFYNASGTTFRFVKYGLKEVPSGISYWLRDSDGNIVYQDNPSYNPSLPTTSAEASGNPPTLPVENPDYVESVSVRCVFAVKTGVPGESVVFEFWKKDDRIYMFDPNNNFTQEITDKVHENLFVLISDDEARQMEHTFYNVRERDLYDGLLTTPNSTDVDNRVEGYYLVFAKDVGEYANGGTIFKMGSVWKVLNVDLEIDVETGTHHWITLEDTETGTQQVLDYNLADLRGETFIDNTYEKLTL